MGNFWWVTSDALILVHGGEGVGGVGGGGGSRSMPQKPVLRSGE